ncbi:hypothetical protein ACPXCB_04045 [Micromonospora sp. DT62]
MRELFGPGPYTTGQFRQLGEVHTTPDPVSVAMREDPEVLAATESVTVARIAFDQRNREWVDAVMEVSRAELSVDADAARRQTEMERAGDFGPAPRDLLAVRRAEHAREAAADVRSRAWAAVVKANDRLLTAQRAVRARMTQGTAP